MKFRIEIEKLEDDLFRVVADDDVVTTEYTTSSPMATVRKVLIEFGVKGKKGRKRTIRPIAPDLVDQ